MGDSLTDATPTARDSFRYGPDGARYFKKTEWAVDVRHHNDDEDVAQVLRGRVREDGDGRRRHGGAHAHRRLGGAREDDPGGHDGDPVVGVRVRAPGPPGLGGGGHERSRPRNWWCWATTRTRSGATTTGRRGSPGAEIETLLGAHGERVSRGFTGHEHPDRTGQIHMNGRVYDPRLGRFLSPDPIVGDPTSSQSWNLYSYVGNNPLSYVDPTGLVQAGADVPGPEPDKVHGRGRRRAGGGSTTRTITVTTTVTVHGVMAVPLPLRGAGVDRGRGWKHRRRRRLGLAPDLRLLLGCDLLAVPVQLPGHPHDRGRGPVGRRPAGGSRRIGRPRRPMSARGFSFRATTWCVATAGTRCSRLAFMRTAGIVHAADWRSISSHRAHRASPERTA